MSEVQQVEQDLRYVRSALARREGMAQWPASIAILWGLICLTGFTLLDLRPAAAGWFWMTAPVLGFLASLWLGWRAGRRLGECDRAEAVRYGLHFGAIFLGLLAVVLIAVAGRLRGETVSQVITLVGGVVWFLGGVHFDRRLLWGGLVMMAGAVAPAYVDRYAWTALGVAVLLALVVPMLAARPANE